MPPRTLARINLVAAAAGPSPEEPREARLGAAGEPSGEEAGPCPGEEAGPCPGEEAGPCPGEEAGPCPGEARSAEPGGAAPPGSPPGRRGRTSSPFAVFGVLAAVLVAFTAGLLAVLAPGTPFDGSSRARSRSAAPGGARDREPPP